MSARARIAALVFACCCSLAAVAQEHGPAKRDDLDVTMQIIVDPNAKLPDEVVRRIPLPAPTPSSGDKPARSNDTKPAPEVKENRAKEARELGREAAERANERAREAQRQRDDARNANADRGKGKDKDKDKDRDRPNPGRPPRP